MDNAIDAFTNSQEASHTERMKRHSEVRKRLLTGVHRDSALLDLVNRVADEILDQEDINEKLENRIKSLEVCMRKYVTGKIMR